MAQRRVDAFASVLSLGGTAKAFVDVNDPSLDGNRRVIYDVDGPVSEDVSVAKEPGFSSDPDQISTCGTSVDFATHGCCAARSRPRRVALPSPISPSTEAPTIPSST